MCSLPAIGSGRGFVDLALTTISHVSSKFNEILFVSVHFSILSTSTGAESLIFHWSTNSHIICKFMTGMLLSGPLTVRSFIIKENKNGPRTVPCGTPLFMST